MTRAQAAIEYLSTYGWAILIMLVAVALLLWLGVMNPKTPLQSTCFFPLDFTCRAYILNTTGSYKLDLAQSTGHPISITKIRCSANTSTSLGTADEITPISISNGGHAIVTNGTQLCYLANGSATSGLSGNMYKGRIFVEYVELDTMFTRQVVGDVNLKYEDVEVG